MARIEILGTGRVDERESAFPQAIQLPSGDILCSYSNQEGQFATGGTDWSRSVDGGETWDVEGTLLPGTDDPVTSNFLKLSLAIDGRTIYAYGSRTTSGINESFGHQTNDAIFCTSTDGGHTWSAPRVIPTPTAALEISHGILTPMSGRLLAPAATILPGRLGEQVLVMISDDGGQTWPRHAVALQDPDGKNGYFEQKLAELGPNRLIATAWTVTLDDVADRPNHYAISSDGGLTWTPPRSIGTRGQTLTAVSLGGDRAMLLYNRRYGDQGIVMALATITDHDWPIHFEGLLYDAHARREGRQRSGGVDEMIDFAFGFPTALRLFDGSYLVTNWSVEGAHCGIRWTKVRVDW